MILDPINPSDKRIWDILNTVVQPVAFRPEMTLEEINKVLITTHEMVVKTLINDQFTRNELGNTFADSVKNSYYESTIQNDYGLITFKILEAVSSRYILSNLLFYIERKKIFDYIYSMITQEYTIPLIKKYREKIEQLTFMDIENKAIADVHDATTQLHFAIMVSYDFDVIRESCNIIANAQLREEEKNVTIINTLRLNKELTPDIVYEIALNAQNLASYEDRLRKFIKEMSLLHLPNTYFRFFRTICKRSDATQLKDQAERTKRERDNYHTISGVRCDGLNAEQIEVLNKIINESIFLDSYKDIIDKSFILQNVKIIIRAHKHLNDTVTMDNDAVYFTDTTGKMKPRAFAYKDRILEDEFAIGDDDELPDNHGIEDIDDEEVDRLNNDNPILSMTGIGPNTFGNIYFKNKLETLPKGPAERIKHRRRTINKLKNKFKLDYRVMAECSILEKGDYYEGFHYFDPNKLTPGGIFRTNNEKLLLYMLIELETHYRKTRVNIYRERKERQKLENLEGGRF